MQFSTVVLSAAALLSAADGAFVNSSGYNATECNTTFVPSTLVTSSVQTAAPTWLVPSAGDLVVEKRWGRHYGNSSHHGNHTRNHTSWTPEELIQKRGYPNRWGNHTWSNHTWGNHTWGKHKGHPNGERKAKFHWF